MYHGFAMASNATSGGRAAFQKHRGKLLLFGFAIVGIIACILGAFITIFIFWIGAAILVLIALCLIVWVAFGKALWRWWSRRPASRGGAGG